MSKAVVYAIVNDQTGEAYVGSTSDFYQRMHVHKWRANPANAGKPNTTNKLYENMRRHGMTEFTFTILSSHKTVEAARKREAQLIRKYQPALNTIGKK